MECMKQSPTFQHSGKIILVDFKGTDLFEKIFARILQEAYNNGFVSDEQLFIDGSHIKASANTHKSKDIGIRKQARNYEKELFAEIQKDREEHGKKPLNEKNDEVEIIHQKSKHNRSGMWFVS